MSFLIDDTAKVEGYLGVTAAVAQKVERHLRAAQAWVIERKGQDWYDARLAEGDTTESRKRAEEAEVRMALCFSLDALNMRVDDDGGIVYEEAPSTQAAQTRYYDHDAIAACRRGLTREVYRLLDLSVPVVEETAVDGGCTAIRVGTGGRMLRLSAVLDEVEG